MTLKRNAKFEGKLICCFKNGKNLLNFDLSTPNSQNPSLICSFSYITFDLKSTWELSFMTLKNDAKFDEKLT